MILRVALILLGLVMASPSLAQSKALCVDNEKTIQEILSNLKKNNDNSRKYDGYRTALAEETDTSLTARLIYAEVLAANCSHLNSEILPGISEVIGNRVRVRKGDSRSVIFERNQFASSLNNYEKSRYRDFLCPKDTALWNLAMKAADKALKKDPQVLPKNAFNYYLYLHEPSWPVVDWADRKKHQPVKTSNFDKIDLCIRFFNHLKYN